MKEKKSLILLLCTLTTLANSHQYQRHRHYSAKEEITINDEYKHWLEFQEFLIWKGNKYRNFKNYNDEKFRFNNDLPPPPPIDQPARMARYIVNQAGNFFIL